jgi:hypothetical protein
MENGRPPVFTDFLSVPGTVLETGHAIDLEQKDQRSLIFILYRKKQSSDKVKFLVLQSHA